MAVINGGYLATYTYRASQGAEGVFVVDVANGDAGQTFLVAPQNGVIDIDNASPAVVGVKPRRSRH